MTPRKKIQKVLVRQQAQQDCGIACLATIINFYGGEYSFEDLRQKSGTSKTGTTIKGLIEAGADKGLDLEAFEVQDIKCLTEQQGPFILLVANEQMRNHFVVAFNAPHNGLTIADPAKGIYQCSVQQPNAIRMQNILIQVSVTESFEQIKRRQNKVFKYFYDVVKKDLPLLAIALTLGLAVATLGISINIFIQQLIDKILPEKKITAIFTSIVLLGFVLALRTFLAFVRNKILFRQTRDFNDRISTTFYSALLTTPQVFFLSRSTGDLVARINDTRRIQSTISQLFGGVAIDILTVIVAISFICIQCPALVFLPVAFLATCGILVLKKGESLAARQKQLLIQNSTSESHYIDTIQGIETIKSLNKESVFLNINNERSAELQQKSYQLSMAFNHFATFTELLTIPFLIISLLVCAHFLTSGDLKIGQMIAILSTLTTAFPAIVRCTLSLFQLQESKLIVERLIPFAAKAPLKDSPTQSKIRIETFSLDKVAFGFPGRKLIFNDVSFTIRRGEIIAITGASGIGKSTLFRLIQRTFPLNAGKASVNGKDWTAFDDHSWKKCIASVPQEIKIFNASLIFNIVLSNEADEITKGIQFCHEYGFHHFFNPLPNSYNAYLGEEGIHVSGGQRQLIALARALYSRPEILLLDEFTSAMDPSAKQFAFELLKGRSAEMLVIISTHDLTYHYIDSVYELTNKNLVSKKSS